MARVIKSWREREREGNIGGEEKKLQIKKRFSILKDVAWLVA